MEIYHLLIIAAILSFILELFTATFLLLSVGIGFLLAGTGNYFEMTTEWQIYLFSIGVVITFFAIRPIMNKYGFSADAKHTNQNALIGKIGLVSEEINNEKDTGLIKVDGDVWKARSTEDSTIINKDEKVEIIHLESIVVTVKKLKL